GIVKDINAYGTLLIAGGVKVTFTSFDKSALNRNQDATCVDTLAASHLPSTSQKAAAAAESAQMLKRRKYSVICNDYVFAALAFETLGPWTSDTKNFINIVSQKLVFTSGDPRAGAYLAQRLSLAIQRGNSASILGPMPISEQLDGLYLNIYKSLVTMFVRDGLLNYLTDFKLNWHTVSSLFQLKR
ncbi:jg4793, partial [Pararge aegeria aegeria]